MRSRLNKVAMFVAALAALAAGGSAIATAGSHAKAKPAKASVSKASLAKAKPSKSGGAQGAKEGQPGPDTDNVQEGDQTTPDSQSEQSSESSSESASESGPSDGPGGFADTSANADTQQQGEN